MRHRVTQAGLSVQAIVGSRAVFLAFDLDAGDRDQCLGFAIHRVDHDANPPEQYWLLSFKTFQSVVPNPVASQRYSTLDHPIQSFYWGDYTVRPGCHYTYRVVPRYGQAKNLTSKPGVEASLDVTTQDPDAGVHGVYFNRGVAASQAYATKFVQPPDQLDPADRDEAMKWLSRGLYEAIVAFIGQANSAQWALRAAAYEFTEPGVLAAFKTAHDQGADVQIVYHAKADSTGNGNRAAITAAALPASMLIERTNTTIAHNKYIVLCAKNPAGTLQARAVWTGSTNLSEGGIFGHSNVGHAVRDPIIAAEYLDHWHQLRPDPDTPTLKTWIDQHSPFDTTALTQAGIHSAFSPRTGTKLLAWYGTRNASAPVVSNITLAFGMTKDLETPLEADTSGGIRYVMLDKPDNNQAAWDNRPQVLTAVGASGGPDVLTRWAKETLTGFNPLVKYLHTKILLLDPVSANPTVISGSANFSPASTNANDENMLIINGDVDLADVYLTEYARIFNHFYARYWAAQLNTTPGNATTASFLRETPDWQTPYYQPGNPKALVRQLFTTQVQANT